MPDADGEGDLSRLDDEQAEELYHQLGLRLGYPASNQTAGSIADENDHLIEFGRAVKSLEQASASLRQNGHETVDALEAAESVIEDLNVCFHEAAERHRIMEETIAEHRRGEHSEQDRWRCPLCKEEYDGE